jgi:hypothetical protein
MSEPPPPDPEVYENRTANMECLAYLAFLVVLVAIVIESFL